MNAIASIKPAAVMDEIRTVYPRISDAEYELRRKMRFARTVATTEIARLQHSDATSLYWAVVETATRFMLAPLPMEVLEMAAEQCRRLIVVAQTAEKLEALT